jgi:uncharacterized protein (DUF2235 family)
LGKNIVVFSDGTGQDGAVRLDARLSNIYKLYRACRIGPDTRIDPAEQIAFYDPGLGTDADSHAWGKLMRTLYKMWASIAGRGIGTNIADCYEFIINHWRPGDRIFIFGFSRGAYTARCVAQVLSLCGIPMHGSGDPKAPFKRFGRQARLVAERAVHQVYEHGAGYERATYESERDELARRFRDEFGCIGDNDLGKVDPNLPNASPHFIGVFDTVAALGASGFKRSFFIGLLALAALAGVAVVSGIAWWLLPAWLFWRVLAVVGAVAMLLASGRIGLAFGAGVLFAFAGLVMAVLGLGMDLPPLPEWLALIAVGAVVGIACLIKLRHDSYRFIDNGPNGKGRKGHHIRWKAANYDRGLSGHVGYARHALAIDETRADFPRVPWGKDDIVRKRVGSEPDPFVQLNFAGNHSDIGGSYPEPESRLSDVALEWMVDEARSIPDPLIVDDARLQLFPDSTGMQHNEPEAMRENSLWWVPSWAPAWLRGWKEEYRKVNGFPLHPSVFQRFAAPEVEVNGTHGPYRPYNSRNDRRFAWAYGKSDPEFEKILAAQREATCDANGVKLVLGKAEQPLADLLKAHKASSAVGIFPGNPRPDADSEYVDALALSMLKAEVSKSGRRFVLLSRIATGANFSEAGLLAFDIADADARRLANSFGAMTMIRASGAGKSTLADITPKIEKASEA